MVKIDLKTSFFNKNMIFARSFPIWTARPPATAAAARGLPVA